MCTHTLGMSVSSLHKASVNSLISYICVINYFILLTNLAAMFSLAVRCKTGIMVSKGSLEIHSALGGNKAIGST